MVIVCEIWVFACITCIVKEWVDGWVSQVVCTCWKQKGCGLVDWFLTTRIRRTLSVSFISYHFSSIFCGQLFFVAVVLELECCFPDNFFFFRTFQQAECVNFKNSLLRNCYTKKWKRNNNKKIRKRNLFFLCKSRPMIAWSWGNGKPVSRKKNLPKRHSLNERLAIFVPWTGKANCRGQWLSNLANVTTKRPKLKNGVSFVKRFRF